MIHSVYQHLTMVSPSRAHHFPFNHFENLGKPNFDTLKLDEFLISLKESQQFNVVHPSSSSSSSSSSSAASSPFFQLGELSNKEITPISPIHQQQEDFNSIDPQSLLQQQIGETTLEDFLIRAGVINAASVQNGTINFDLPPPPPHQHRETMAIDPMVMMSMPESDSNFQSVYENPGELSVPMPEISVASSESRAEKKRRYSDEMMVKTIERRQKRMIKNRESAARSRARKQAYTDKLENEVSELKKKNAWLRKLKEKEMVLFSDPTCLPRFQLRRTSSATF
ncbi:ABSCISIC ACID-INSENSITIVE 5-like protein 3 [Euphorbia lathyris]|uniref:ABSCISIC ACID-INSENSITIVE 5-like protein 3 n=1 Tax=Euphorbia lathyris TaxID=212925 RepID=UPI0033141E8F